MGGGGVERFRRKESPPPRSCMDSLLVAIVVFRFRAWRRNVEILSASCLTFSVTRRREARSCENLKLREMN